MAGKQLLKFYFEHYLFKPTAAQLIDTADVVYPMFPVKAGQLCARVDCRILVLFDGTTPVMLVGDGDDPDGYMDAGDITEGTAGIYMGKAAFHNAQGGKLYTADDNVDLTFTGVAGATTGQALFSGVFARLF
jgi:hypothetical protein